MLSAEAVWLQGTTFVQLPGILSLYNTVENTSSKLHRFAVDRSQPLPSHD
jgi:hypothetical protein